MIVETIFSTLDIHGRPNFAPMGILWGEEEVVLRPFHETATYRNLLATGYGVANLTDDAMAYVQSALYDTVLPHFPASIVPGVVFLGACSWLELSVISEVRKTQRAEIRCRVVSKGWQRDFLGFCRARNAIIEATILATRLHLKKQQDVLDELRRYEQIVQKTGDEAERVAFQGVIDFVRRWSSDHRD